MNVCFLLGKGGVGKTTLSLTLGYKLSMHQECDILVVSLDPAHNIGNFLSMEVGEIPTKIEKNLYALEINFEKTLRALTNMQIERLKSLYPEFKVWNLERDLDTLRFMPGSEEQALLRELEVWTKGEWSWVIFDMPPTGLALRVLSLPSLMLFWLDKLIRLRERINSLRESIRSVEGSKPKEDRVIEALRNQTKRYTHIVEMIKSQDSTHFYVVLEPTVVSIEEARKIKDSLEKKGIWLKAALLNKLKGKGSHANVQKMVKETLKIPVYTFPFVEDEANIVERLVPLMPIPST